MSLASNNAPRRRTGRPIPGKARNAARPHSRDTRHNQAIASLIDCVERLLTASKSRQSRDFQYRLGDRVA